MKALLTQVSWSGSIIIKILCRYMYLQSHHTPGLTESRRTIAIAWFNAHAHFCATVKLDKSDGALCCPVTLRNWDNQLNMLFFNITKYFPCNFKDGWVLEGWDSFLCIIMMSWAPSQWSSLAFVKFRAWVLTKNSTFLSREYGRKFGLEVFENVFSRIVDGNTL